MNIKRLFAAALVAASSTAAFAASTGDMVIDGGIGVGMVNYPSSTAATFTQRVGAEWVVAPSIINGDFSIAVGAYLNNAVGGSLKVYGPFYNNMPTWTASHRRDDFSLIPTASMRYRINSDFEAYGSFGIGMGVMHSFYANEKHYQPVNGYFVTGLDSATKMTVALSCCVGVRYYLGEHWGLSSQLGIVSANLKSSWSSSYNIFTVGASYRF